LEDDSYISMNQQTPVIIRVRIRLIQVNIY